MKRIVTLLLAAGLVLGAAGAGQAADVKVKGQWDFAFQWANTSFKKGNADGDYFAARQRLRTQVDFIASESLKGVVFFEIGDQNWGRTAQGASLGTDGTVVEVRYSYIDWVVPNTDLKVRMGLQPIGLPGFVADSAVLNHDGAGITLSYDFNDNVGTTFFWSRLANDNFDGSNFNYDKKYRSDAFDLFGLTVPLTFDGVKVTPWAAFASIGRNALSGTGAEGHAAGNSAQWTLFKHGMTPIGAAGSFDRSQDSSGTAWWAGVTGDITVWNPFRLAFDFNYGSVDMGSTDTQTAFFNRDRQALDRGHQFDFKRSGWMVSLLAEYKFDMVTPGLLFWYASGDDSNPYDGSERMPSMRSAWKPTSYGFDNDYAIGSSVMLGNDPSGLWAVQLRFKDISFIQDLSHLFSVTYYRGTNNEEMANYTTPYVTTTDAQLSNGIGGYTYLTKKDSAWEVNFDSTYKIYENLFLNVELGYIHLGLKDSVWGSKIVDDTNKNNFKAAVNMRYTF